MRIHTNRFRADKVRDALIALRTEAEPWEGGPDTKVAPHLDFKVLSERGSRSHDFAIEVQLEATERDRGRRAGNSGSYGAMRPDADGYAATHDEWGWLLAALYAIDPDMVVGSPSSPVYADRQHFDERTGYHYNPDEWRELADEYCDGSDPYPYAPRSSYIGRKGANREQDNDRGWYIHKPRKLRTA